MDDKKPPILPSPHTSAQDMPLDCPSDTNDLTVHHGSDEEKQLEKQPNTELNIPNASILNTSLQCILWYILTISVAIYIGASTKKSTCSSRYHLPAITLLIGLVTMATDVIATSNLEKQIERVPQDSWHHRFLVRLYHARRWIPLSPAMVFAILLSRDCE